MEINTLNVKKAEQKIVDSCAGLPLSVAYFLLRAKADELEKLYEQQAMKEYYEEQKKEKQESKGQQ